MKDLTEDDINEFDDKTYQLYGYDSVLVLDGIINVASYNLSNHKILWILKEPYGEDAFKYSDYINGFEFGKSFPTSRAMWEKITYVNYGILNNYQLWADFKTLYKDENVFRALHNCALINLKKNPGKTKSNHSEIRNAYQRYKDRIHEQLKFINPDIIICGGTFNFLQLPFDKVNLIIGENLKGYKHDNKLFIDAYHPSYFVKKQEEYCDEIINFCAKNI